MSVPILEKTASSFEVAALQIPCSFSQPGRFSLGATLCHERLSTVSSGDFSSGFRKNPKLKSDRKLTETSSHCFKAKSVSNNICVFKRGQICKGGETSPAPTTPLVSTGEGKWERGSGVLNEPFGPQEEMLNFLVCWEASWRHLGGRAKWGVKLGRHFSTVW